MKTIGWKLPVQHLTKSGESRGGIHSPTVANGNRLELKVQEKRPRLRADRGADRAHSAGASVMLGTWAAATVGATVHTHGIEGSRVHVRVRDGGHYKRAVRKSTAPQRPQLSGIRRTGMTGAVEWWTVWTLAFFYIKQRWFNKLLYLTSLCLISVFLPSAYWTAGYKLNNKCWERIESKLYCVKYVLGKAIQRPYISTL